MNAPQYYVMCILPVFISLYKIPLIIVSHITLPMDIVFPYSVWGIHRNQRNIWTSIVFSVIKELRLKKTSSIEKRNSWWIRLRNSTWKPLHVLPWAANDVQSQYSPLISEAPNVNTAEGNGLITWITRKRYCFYNLRACVEKHSRQTCIDWRF